MRLFSCGFNLYNQLNSISNKHILQEFQCTFEDLIEEISILFFQIRHTFSFIVHNNNLVQIYRNSKSIQHKISDHKIDQATANDDCILLLNNVGQLFKISILDDFSHVEILSNRNFIEMRRNDKFKLISCSSTLTIFYTEHRLLYNGIGEKICDFQNEIVQIATGKEHCLLLDTNGHVYSFGNGSRGQLGFGQLETVEKPQLIEALAGIKICKVAAGGWHSAALSLEGDLYIWGWNANGQLGLCSSSYLPSMEKTNVSVMALPQLVDIDLIDNNEETKENVTITDIDCGARHTVVSLDNNYIFGCGWNKYKQLKNTEQEQYNCFVLLTDLSKASSIVKKRIICGDWNTTYMVSG